MNIAKNMEVIFIAAIALIGSASLATAAAPAHQSVHQRASSAIVAQAGSAQGASMQVVTVSAKRLTAAEKAQLPQ